MSGSGSGGGEVDGGGEVVRFGRDGLTFEALAGGPADGSPVVLLHGFPQDATAWDRVVPLLHEQGLRTYALQQRGYADGARPRDVAAYRMGELVGDVLALLDHLGLDRAHVVGHDWGGAVAWAVAAWHPERVAALTVLSTPHPAALRHAVRHGDQVRRSWYIGAFQLPLLPEVAMARMLRRGGLTRSGLRRQDADRYARRLGSRERLRGPIHWYRAAARPGDTPPIGTVTVPTTYVWGSRDPFLGRDAAEGTAEHVRAEDGAGEGYRFVELAAGHWLPEKRPVEVAEEIVRRA